MKRSMPAISSNQVKRSRTSCSQCRLRKIKCDDSTPTCGPCRKGSRPCEQRPWIIFHKERLRDRREPEKSSDRACSTLRSAPDGNVWVRIPEKVVFVTDPECRLTEQDAGNDYSHPLARVPSSSDNIAPTHHDRPWNEKPIETQPNLGEDYENDGNLRKVGADNFSGSDIRSPPMNRIRGEDSIMSPNDSIPRASLQSISLNTFASPGGAELNTDNLSGEHSTRLVREKEELAEDFLEIAFLLRHFSETSGQWMDLFDLDCYFARQVPILAKRSRLLRYAACAYAAKQLGRVDGKKAVMGGVTSRQARMEVFPIGNKAEWHYRGTKYYDKALSLLRDQISQNEERDFRSSISPRFHHQSSSTASFAGDVHQLNGPENGFQATSEPLQELPDANITVVAAAVLCVYEFLDAANVEWAGHLDGTKSLLDIAFADNGGLFSPRTYQLFTLSENPTRSLTPSKARKAAFWNFARQDFLAAFINETTTRLDPEDVNLWRTAGLALDRDGFINPSNVPEYDRAENEEPMREDMISNALIWLLSKLVNFLVSRGPTRRTPDIQFYRGDQQRLSNNNSVEIWMRLQEEIEIWYNGLPETFRPSAEIQASRDARYNEIWYSIPMCASTIQSYHMARILLLVNKPGEPDRTGSSVLNMIHSHRDIEEELRHHCSKICGIALGRSEGATRVHMLQPLYVAGLCMTDAREQRTVVELLKEIETDLGWATEYRVKRLVEVWKWEEKGISE